MELTPDNFEPSPVGMTIEEFIDTIQMELTISCSLPKNLPDEDIRRIIEKRAIKELNDKVKNLEREIEKYKK